MNPGFGGRQTRGLKNPGLHSLAVVRRLGLGLGLGLGACTCSTVLLLAAVICEFRLLCGPFLNLCHVTLFVNINKSTVFRFSNCAFWLLVQDCVEIRMTVSSLPVDVYPVIVCVAIVKKKSNRGFFKAKTKRCSWLTESCQVKKETGYSLHLKYYG